jgi:hypothetical protein
MARDKALKIAFRAGSVYNIHDSLIMATTIGPWVHTEIIFPDSTGPRAYAAYEDIGGFVKSRNTPYNSNWTVVSVPLTKPDQAHAVLLHTLDAQPGYNQSDLWQCCVKAWLPWERDLNCEAPQTWTNGVFCSQVCLLLLRRMARQGSIAVPETVSGLLEHVHSRGCSPNTLFGILKHMVPQGTSPPQKTPA